jgi:hypothetical protein
MSPGGKEKQFPVTLLNPAVSVDIFNRERPDVQYSGLLVMTSSSDKAKLTQDIVTYQGWCD